MPAIRGWTFVFGTSTTATSIQAVLPPYQQNDLLLAILSADTGTQVWTASGWIQLFSITNTNNLAVMYKIAGASESNPTFTYTVAETANCHLLSIRDVNTVTPFNGTGGAGVGYRTANNSAAKAALPILTTTVADSLILYLASESGAVVPGILSGPCTWEDASDGSAHSDGFSWGFKRSAGATPSDVFVSKNGTAAGVIATIGVSPPLLGATVIPPYCAADNSIYVDPIHGVTAYNSNTAFAATATTSFGTSLNGATLSNGTAAVASDVGINSFHSMGQITGVVTSGTWSGARLALNAANKPNVSGKNVICHVKPSTPKVYQTTDPLSKSGTKGVAFGMSSLANTNYRMWHVHGAGTLWDSAQHVPIVINDQNASGRIQDSGTLDPASIESFGFAISGFTTAPVFQFGSLWVLDTTVVAGGVAAEPVGITGINKVCSTGKERMSVLQQGAGQALIMQPVQFGDGGTNSVYLDLNATAIEFPKQYDVNSGQVFYCSVDNVAGLTYYAGASDTIKHRNSVVSSQSPFHWRIHASSSASAAYDFSGLSIIGAGDVTLRQVTTFSSMSFTDCPVVTQNAAVMNACSFINSKLNSNSPASISGCSFVSGGSGHAIEITTAGNYTFTGNKFVGYGSSGTTNAAIYNNSGGAVTLNVTGGGTTPTIRNGTGASTTVNANVSVTLTGLKNPSEVRVFNAGTQIEISGTGAENVTSGAHTFSVGSGVSVDISVLSLGYQNLRLLGYSTVSDATVPVSQVIDRQYANT